MREKIKQLIAEHIARRGALKVTMHNYDAIEELTDEIRDRILDEMTLIDKSIATLKEVLKTI